MGELIQDPVPDDHPKLRAVRRTWRGFMWPIHFALGIQVASVAGSIVAVIATGDTKWSTPAIIGLPLIMVWWVQLKRDRVHRARELAEAHKMLVDTKLTDPAEYVAFGRKHGIWGNGDWDE